MPEVTGPLQEWKRHAGDKSRRPLGKRQVEVMAASHCQLTETVQTEAAEKWVFLQNDGDVAKKQLLEEQDGNAKGERESTGQQSVQDMEKLLRWCKSWSYDATELKEIIRDSAERLESAQSSDTTFGWFPSAWNDTFVLNALRNDMRLYLLVATLFVNTGLLVLAALASLMESDELHALLNGLKHFTTMTQNAAVLSMATKFLSLMAVKASAVDKSRHAGILCGLIIATVAILRVTSCTLTDDADAGIRVLEEAWRQANSEWFRAEGAMTLACTGATVLSTSLLVLMAIDGKVTLAACYLHWRMISECAYLAPGRSLDGWAGRKPSIGLMIAALLVCLAVLLPAVGNPVLPNPSG
ncbi:hypothetical protein MRX96_056693 [Rhipicephalus microplus]